MIKENFITQISAMQAYYGKNIKSEIVALYWNSLKDISDELFNSMVSYIMENFIPSSQVPFPLIAHFKGAAGLSGESRVQSAITTIKQAVERFGAYKSVDFGDPALHAVINRFGGWPEICSWGNKGEWKFQEKNFLNAYKCALESNENAGPVSGLFEIDNNGKDDRLWSDRQKQFAIGNSKPRQMEWRGADFSNRIENKTEPQKQIDSINSLIENIGTEK